MSSLAISDTQAFRGLIGSGGTNVIRLSPRSPNLKAYAERFVRSVKEECLNRMIFIGPVSLRYTVVGYPEHYHAERNHQGLDNRLIHSTPSDADNEGIVGRRQRLAETLNFYYREAA